MPKSMNSAPSREQRKSRTRRHLARVIVTLGAKKTGKGWQARCPAHDDAKPSLSIRMISSRRLRFLCYAGCSEQKVLEAVRARLREHGDLSPEVSPSLGPTVACRDTDSRTQTAKAMVIWGQSKPIRGTLAESYLRSRGLHCPSGDSLRFHQSLPHAAGRWPAMIALVANSVTGRPVGIHRTFLARDGLGKAPIDPPRMMLGPCGSGVVRLGVVADGRSLLIGEGIETVLSGMQATGLPGWAALSAQNLSRIRLPENARNVILLQDGDDAGKAAVKRAALLLLQEHRRVRIADAGDGLDFNDLLLG